MRRVLAAALAVVLGHAHAQEPLVAEPYRDVRVGFEILLPPGYDFGLIGSTVYFAPPERIARLELSGYGTEVFGPFLHHRGSFEGFGDCRAPAGAPAQDTEYRLERMTVAGQPAFSCTISPIDVMGALMSEQRVRVQTPRGGALQFELTSCAHEQCDGARAWFEAMIASLRWLD
jgi:hypothetical protein